jgi:hypothetical protein
MVSIDMRKILVVGLLAALAIGLGYPVAVSALSIAKTRATASEETQTSSQAQDESISDVENYIRKAKLYREGDDEESYGHHNGHKSFHIPKVILTDLVNITSSSITNVTTKDLASLVLTKKGGNYSLMILVKARSSKHVFHLVANVTGGVSISDDSVNISGKIVRSNLPGFTDGSTIQVTVKVGSTSISSSGNSISGSNLALIFRR